MIEEAKTFATKAHEGQVRKYTGEPYINHPMAVAEIVRQHGGDAGMQAAAYLHDVVEDCDIELDRIGREFNFDIMQLVFWLSSASVLMKYRGNRAARKLFDNNVFQGAPVRAKLIKFADLIDNTSSIVAHDPDFANTYLREKKEVLAQNYVNHPLWYEATRAAGGF